MQKKQIASKKWPEGIAIEWTGQFQHAQETQNDLALVDPNLFTVPYAW